MSTRILSIGDRHARSRWTLDYRVRADLTVGLELNGHNREVAPRATWFITPARRGRPSVTLGMSSDRLSTPQGQALFLTFSQPLTEGLCTPFWSIKYSTDSRRAAFPFGFNLARGGWTLQTIYDSNYTHLLLTRSQDWGSTSFVLARTKHPGVAISIGF